MSTNLPKNVIDYLVNPNNETTLEDATNSLLQFVETPVETPANDQREYMREFLLRLADSYFKNAFHLSQIADDEKKQGQKLSEIAKSYFDKVDSLREKARDEFYNGRILLAPVKAKAAAKHLRSQAFILKKHGIRLSGLSETHFENASRLKQKATDERKKGQYLLDLAGSYN